MELAPTKAFEFAARLTTIPGFPNRNEAIEALADDLREICVARELDGELWDADRQAVWLTREARLRMTTWGGTSALRQIHTEKFAPERLTSYPNPSYLGNPQCPDCNGTGYVTKEVKTRGNGPVLSGSSRCTCVPHARKRKTEISRSDKPRKRSGTLFD